jgi:TatD DNase family protein
MIDSHCHIYSEEFDSDRDLMIDRAKQSGLKALYMPNIDLESIEPMLSLERRYPGFCIPMMGLHPTSVKADYKEVLDSIIHWFDKRNFCAVGEVGIDLYWDKTYLNQQIDAFECQLEIAVTRDLPVVIHCRDAFPEVFASVEKFLGNNLRGVFHSFSGGVDEVRRIVSYGSFMFGINGIVTFKNSSIAGAVREIPVEKLVAETDAPYLAPVPHRGRRNEPAYIGSIVAKLAELHGVPLSQMIDITTRNADRLFSGK